jgi:predicted RNA-binding Zn-ribbon protein involved in translation (DUF1610 family)
LIRHRPPAGSSLVGRRKDKRPWSVVNHKGNSRFKCPGCGKAVAWRIHEPTWRPTTLTPSRDETPTIEPERRAVVLLKRLRLEPRRLVDQPLRCLAHVGSTSWSAKRQMQLEGARAGRWFT